MRNKGLDYLDGTLRVGSHSYEELADRHGTPLYVYDEATVRRRYSRLREVLSERYDDVRVHYAVKANSNLALLRVLQQEGAGVDCVSPGEVYLALKAGFPPEKVLYTGNYFSAEELEFAHEKGVMVNLDAPSHVRHFARAAARSDGPKPLVSFRVNPEFGAGHHEHVFTAGKHVKFGILDDQIVDAYRAAQRAGFERFGIHMHIGSGILDVDKFVRAAEKFLDVAGLVRRELDLKFEFLDFGGGLGIPYRLEEEPLDLHAYASSVVGLFKRKISELDLGSPAFVVEPGRYLVAEAGTLLTTVTTVKRTTSKTFVGVDAGFNVLVRPTMYGSYHHVLPATPRDGARSRVDVVGQICESGDVLAKDRELPPLEEGDRLVFLDAGAYGFSMSSEYNSRPRPAEVLLSGAESHVVRERERIEDLDARQRVPPHLR